MSVTYKPNPNAWNALVAASMAALEAASVVTQTAIKAELTRSGASNRSNPQGKSAAPGDPPAVMTGRLRRSIVIEPIKREGDRLSQRVGTNVVYAPILEYGGIINPKRAKRLTVPIHPRAKALSAQGKSAREVPGLFVLKTKSGAYLAKKVGGKRARIELWYALLSSVTIRKHPFMRPAREKSKARAMEAAAAAFKRTLASFK